MFRHVVVGIDEDPGSRDALALARALMLAGDGRERTASVAHGGLIVWALASGALAFFPDDPVGTATHGLGKVHFALAFIAFAAVIVGTIAGSRAARTQPLLRSRAAVLAALAYAALVPLLLLGHAHLRPNSLGGLYEKLFLAIELAWLVVVSWPIASQRARERVPAAAAA